MEPFAVSDLGVDSRYPTIEWHPDDTLTVSYTTALGVESRILVFARPDSVTDDLNPFDQHAVLNPAPNGGGNRKR
jgi:hypothetical protein